ncbi:GNAT family N-acetyltransferase [Ktedonosporobacter rubrisoli]|uniref:GNAT family N-acetyltransferase n=1 Tax=Ktedonosporobacter rubrisoli TaxID=2509675 RepID=A0A4P6JLS4_KTERU|nr:GNAT family N-acetyltransferase [Ktedonosporobacter rubrisoli]QBD75980.1 GNAT family N-acetyltransferase [Ktedonosporobacter rubrisoli]
MSQHLDDFSPQSLVQTIEANIHEFLLILGKTGGGEERQGTEIQWVIGGAPISYHNCVIHAYLTDETADEVIKASVERFQAYKVPGSWHVGPAMRPLDLGTRLLAQGFSYGGAEAGMAVDLLALHEQVSPPPALVIKRVSNEAELQTWTRTLASGFGEGAIEANWVGSQYRRLGFDPSGAWRHYLAYLDELPVATTTLFLGAGVAGIYFVFTLPQMRGQGIGGAITLAALRDARRLGYRIGVLGASEMGYSVYQRLGFREYCRLHLYEWKPSVTKS